MKTFLISLIVSLTCLQLANAQFTKLHEFKKNNDLSTPGESKPVYDGKWVYDVTKLGGSYGLGEIFKIKPDGTGYTKLYDFNGSNGSKPTASLLLDGGMLYGMTPTGGVNDKGVIFKIDTAGISYTKLFDFSTPMGWQPLGGLIISGTTLYGVTTAGGLFYASGVIFNIQTDGSNYTILHKFGGTTPGVEDYSGGEGPTGELVLLNDTLYGMAAGGGTNNDGCIFKLKTDGTGYSKLFDFSQIDGYSPKGSLVYDQGVFYGMTYYGGASYGNVFKITKAGTFTNLLNFDSNSTYGCYPHGSLTLLNGVIYGLTSGNYTGGSIFKMNIDGTEKSNIHIFDDFYGKGQTPYGTLTVINNELYGFAQGGLSKVGCFFKSTIGGTYTKLMDFGVIEKGANPMGISLIGTSLFGVNIYGGLNARGCFYKVNTNGTGFDTISNVMNYVGFSTPNGPFARSNDTLFFTTRNGGVYNRGAVVKITTSGKWLGTIMDFTYDNAKNISTYGENPSTSPVLSGKTLFGTTETGGAYGPNSQLGCIYAVNTNGTNKRTLFNFGQNSSFGQSPKGQLLVSGDTIYGTASAGGANNKGCIYKIIKDSTSYTNLIVFDGVGKGAYPNGGLIRSGNTLYGTTKNGGTNNKGCIFSVNTDGSNFVKLFDFSGTDNGAAPTVTMAFKGNALIGVTDSGGIANQGCLFMIGKDGSNYKKLIDFDGTNYGTLPNGNIIVSGDTIYGTTRYGGAYNIGITYKYVGSKTLPVITWQKPANIVAGNILTATQLNASANTPGTFTYTPSLGTALNAGNDQALKVDFVPTDGSNYSITSKTVYITVKPRPSLAVTWNNPADITFGTILGSGQLNATANIDGAFTYTPVAGTKLNVGDGQILKVDFTPTDIINYSATSKTVVINVKLTSLAINWSNPADISFGTLLGPTQLNATANIDGAFTYTPVAGTKLAVGDGQILKVDFSPTDVANYSPTSKTVTINVKATAPLGITSNHSDNDIKIYPNPAHGTIYVKWHKAYTAMVSLFDISGHLLVSKTLERELESIDISGLQTGVYYLQLNDQKSIETRIIVIE